MGLFSFLPHDLMGGLSRSGQNTADPAGDPLEVRHFLDTLQDTYYRTDASGRLLRISASVKDLLGYDPDELVGTFLADLYKEPDGRVRFLNALSAAGGMIKNYEAELLHKNGQAIWVSTHSRLLRSANGEVLGVEGLARDVTQQKHEQARALTLARAVEQTADMVMITNRRGAVEYVNQAFCLVSGYRADEVIGGSSNIMKSGRQSAAFYDDLWRTILTGEVFTGVLINRRKDGSLYYEEKTITPLKDVEGRITHFVATGRDITERMQTHERLQYLAYHDVLTRLPNRALLMERLDHAATQARRHGGKIALLFLDLDRFKVINDTLGHDVGDGLLQALATRLQDTMREGDTVARLSGDEFAVLLENIESTDNVGEVANKILSIFDRPFEVHDRELFASTSIGISLFPADGDNAQTLLKHADTAMYRAKESGRNTYRFYSAEMSAAAMERLTLETQLRRALSRDEFKIHYQPQVCMTSGKVLGVEALLRWEHPERGTVMPLEFVSILEETGLIAAVGEWVIHTACRQIHNVQRPGSPLRLAINLSPRQFHNGDLIQQLEQATRGSGLSPDQIEFEITESLLMSGANEALDVLSRLSDRGCRFAIDDFGTGYSSLSYLKRFPIDSLKIDRSFVRDIPQDHDDAALVNAIVAMARSLNLEVVAEGVESKDQLGFLRGLGCDSYQGFLHSHPAPVASLAALLATQ